MTDLHAENLAARLRQVRRDRRAARVTPGSARELVVVAFAVPVGAVVLMALCSLITLLGAGERLTSLTSSTASMWLAAHQVPLDIADVRLGVLPLLPTFALVAASAAMTRRATRVRATLGDLTSVLLSVIGGGLLVTALALAVVMDAATVLTVAAPNALVAFACTAAVYGVGAVIGLSIDRRASIVSWLGLESWALRGLRAGAGAGVALLTMAALVLAIRLVINSATGGSLIGGGHGFLGYLALTALSILYLPNFVIGAAGYLVGAKVELGGAAGDLVSGHGGAVPPLPVVATIPDGGGTPWTILLLSIPVLIGVCFGMACRDRDGVLAARSVAFGAVVASTLMVVAASLCGGELGELGVAGVNVPAAGLYWMLCLLLPGMAVVGLTALLPNSWLATVDVGRPVRTRRSRPPGPWGRMRRRRAMRRDGLRPDGGTADNGAADESDPDDLDDDDFAPDEFEDADLDADGIDTDADDAEVDDFSPAFADDDTADFHPAFDGDTDVFDAVDTDPRDLDPADGDVFDGADLTETDTGVAETDSVTDSDSDPAADTDAGDHDADDYDAGDHDADRH
ncbi:hypothetical protein GCM10027169_35570 [Gordonia jinhuaensis]|uniref:Uncharacterized protein n=1 Tax=Gordonia jinhuaensis TaxID=1517702 RepID=A0A916WU27_9ACTN|nr:DUF6350 family protein [Gordonia jinhuaensis]GGB29851.1 hypothetical protein GCM10011489_17560 [Gordonia jinhuaensis]